MHYFKWLKKKKSGPVLGIDINSGSLSAICLSSNQNQHGVEYYHRVEFPTGWVNGDVIHNINDLSNLIKTSISNTMVSSPKQVVIAIPHSSTVIKTIQVSNRLHRRDIAEFVMMDVEKYSSFTRDEICMDFNVLGSSTVVPNMLDILVVIARLELVRQRVQLVHQAGIIPQVVEVESFAIARAIHRVTPPLGYQTVAVFNIDLNRTQSFFLHQSQLVFTHEETLDASSPDVLFEQFKRGLQIFLSTMSWGRVESIFLVGLGSAMPGLAHFFYQQSGITTSIPLFFNEMHFASSLIKTQIEKDSSLLMIACGLALRDTGF